jgi:hypothetical protein
MGPLNEFQRRFLDVTQHNLALLQANAGGSAPEYFGYVLTLGSAASPLLPGSTVQGSIAIQADAWFLWEYLSLGVTIPATANLGGPEQFTDPGNLLLQITNTGTGDDMYNIPAGFAGMPGTLSAGSPIAAAAGIPYIFPTPILLPPNTNINVTLQKNGLVSADNPNPTGAYVMLNGARIQVWQ